MLGERIRRLRTGARMKQSELAGRLGVSTSAVGMYEQGRREPPYHVLLKLGELFGVSVDWLLAREESAAPAQSDDLSDMLSAFHKRLKQQEGLMFHGRAAERGRSGKDYACDALGAELTIRENRRMRGHDPCGARGEASARFVRRA